MAMRYFKCHTDPYPSYDFAADPRGGGDVAFSWRNGPPGATDSGACILTLRLAADTAAVTTYSTAYTATSHTVNATIGDVQASLQRLNATGRYGPATPWIPVKVS